MLTPAGQNIGQFLFVSHVVLSDHKMQLYSIWHFQDDSEVEELFVYLYSYVFLARCSNY